VKGWTYAKPAAHVFVCANVRDGASPLGGGCRERGDRVYDEAKREVSRQGLVTAVWVTKTQCLGMCPKEGCAVAVYPNGELWTEVFPQDVAMIVAGSLGRRRGP
jgi:(2Fe-2S) ferredoxin